MFRWLLCAASAAILAEPVAAQAPVAAKLRWQPNQVLVYQVEYATAASDKVGATTSETKSTVRLTKRWQVQAVDAAGVATLQLSMSAMMQERTTPSGDTLSGGVGEPIETFATGSIRFAENPAGGKIKLNGAEWELIKGAPDAGALAARRRPSK